MSRIITQKAVEAFMNNIPFRESNTEVGISDELTILELHSNMIATRDIKTGTISITTDNWKTNTTKERLNGIPGVKIVQKKGIWYLNDIEWNGSWITI